MTLNVESQALRAYAAQLSAAREAAETAKGYVHTYGDFDMHEKGAIGFLFGRHHNYLDALTEMLDHAARVLDASQDAMTDLSTGYEHTDTRAAKALDASYPPVPRPPDSHEAQERNVPLPPTNVW